LNVGQKTVSNQLWMTAYILRNLWAHNFAIVILPTQMKTRNTLAELHITLQTRTPVTTQHTGNPRYTRSHFTRFRYNAI
jgi:hypothetical protein